MIPLRCRGFFNASAASRFLLHFNCLRKKTKKRRQLPVVVPVLLFFCLAVPFLQQPVVVFAQDRVAVTRVREYFPPTESLPEFEVYYPQISWHLPFRHRTHSGDYGDV